MSEIPAAKPALSAHAYQNVYRVLNSGQLAQGPYVEKLEGEWADIVGVDHAIAVSSGTAALHLALRAHGIGEGDRVAVPALSFAATATAVLHVGATPVFCDIEADTYCLDPLEVPWTDVDAVIPVHLFGHPAELRDIANRAVTWDVTVIEDAAQAHGATYRGEPVGGYSDAGCFSFYATKNVTAAEGGIVTTDDTAAAGRIRRWRSHGMTDRDTHVDLGSNYRMSDVHAAIGVAQATRLDELNAARAEHSRWLLDRVADLDWLEPAVPRDHVGHAWFWAPVEVDGQYDGKRVWRELKERGIETRHRYTVPLQDQPVFEHASEAREAPVARRVAGQVLGLPNYPTLTRNQRESVLEALRDYAP